MHPLIAEVGLNPDEAQLLHDRRGTTFYRVGNYALKITEGLMARREGEVLAAIGADHHLAHGAHGDEGSWLLMPWIDGTSLWDTFAPSAHHDREGARRQLTDRAVRAAGELAQLHDLGWCHGDIQPDHFVHDGTRTRVIDLACAQGPVDLPRYKHRGGITHTTAPEVAELIIETDDHIALTPEADVWSFGASLFWAWTRMPPIAYRCGDPNSARALLMPDVATGRLHEFADVRPYPWPAFEDVLRAALAVKPADRPTAAEVLQALYW